MPFQRIKNLRLLPNMNNPNGVNGFERKLHLQLQHTSATNETMWKHLAVVKQIQLKQFEHFIEAAINGAVSKWYSVKCTRVAQLKGAREVRKEF